MYLEAPSPKGDTSLCLVQWTQGIRQLVLSDWKFILGLNYLSNTGEKGLSKHHSNQAILCVDQGKKHHQLAKYSSVVKEDLSSWVRVNESETQGKCEVPICNSIDIQVTTYNLLPSSTTNCMSSHEGISQKWAKCMG
jgi:hypothetical protein